MHKTVKPIKYISEISIEKDVERVAIKFGNSKNGFPVLYIGIYKTAWMWCILSPYPGDLWK